MLKGSIVAIVTPMREHDESIDYDSLKSLVEWHISEGTNGIVVVGTTGESPTVSFEEHCDLIKATVDVASKRIPVVAGTGANSTLEALELSKFAKEVGADYGLSVVPYYNKPTQDGLYRHFRTIAEKIDLPQILYNVPGRTVADISNDTIVKLSEVDNIVGVKDATADLERGAALIESLRPDFGVYSGDDGTALALMFLGGHGTISVTANVAPKLVANMCSCMLENADYAKAKSYNKKLMKLNEALFLEANPIPVKWALNKMGKIPPGIRLPLTTLSRDLDSVLEEALIAAGVG